MTPSLLRLPAHARRGLASALEAGMLPVPCTPAAVGSILNLREGAEDVVAVVEQLRAIGLDGRAAAAWIRTVDEAVAGVPAPDLVWSGPEVPGLHARDTRRVYEELLGQAARSLWASTFAYFDGQRAFEVLARRMDEVSDLQVKLLLNIQRGGGDTTAPEHLVRRFAERFWREDWPGERRPEVFYDPRSLDPDGPSGVLHAKAVVADDEAVFITSANLTDGPEHRDGPGVAGPRPASVTRHFRGLIERGLLRALPMD